MFKRNQAPQPAWQDRVNRAKALIADHDATFLTRATDVDRVDIALAQADADVARLDNAIVSLDAESATAELKAALRARPNPTDPDSPLITSLRQRHETVTMLQNRRDDLRTKIENTLVDLDALAAKVVELSFVAGGTGADGIDDHLRGLTSDIDALMSAHQQLAAI